MCNLDKRITEPPMSELTESITETKHGGGCCAHDEQAHETEHDWRNDPPKKVPKWAIMLAVISFVVFNAFFLAYALQMSGNPN